MKIINKKRINELINCLAPYKYIYLYGAGNEGRKILELLEKINISPVAVVVSRKSLNPETVMNIPVVQIDTVSASDENIFILGVSELYCQEIEKTLISLKHYNIVKMISRIETWKLNRTLPKLEITAKIGCKIQCRYCPQEALYYSYFKEDIHRCREMSMENYRKCVSHMPEETVITFAGFVEPFLHSHGTEMIQYAHEQGHPVELYTTFMGLTKAQFDTIKDIPFREVVLHTPDKKNYANIQITEEYIKILDEALDLKKANGDPFIDSANCQSEPSEEFLKIAKGRVRVESSLVDRAGILNDSNLKHSGYKTGTVVCNRSNRQNHWVLLPDGSVTLCCMDFGLKHVLGNLLDSDYEAIINNDAYQILRQQMRESREDTDILCRKCTSSSEIKNR